MPFKEEQCGKYVLYMCTSPEVLNKCGSYEFQRDFRQVLFRRVCLVKYTFIRVIVLGRTHRTQILVGYRGPPLTYLRLGIHTYLLYL